MPRYIYKFMLYILFTRHVKDVFNIFVYKNIVFYGEIYFLKEKKGDNRHKDAYYRKFKSCGINT